VPDVSRKRGGLNLKDRTSNEETEHSARKDEAITLSRKVGYPAHSGVAHYAGRTETSSGICCEIISRKWGETSKMRLRVLRFKILTAKVLMRKLKLLINELITLLW